MDILVQQDTLVVGNLVVGILVGDNWDILVVDS